MFSAILYSSASICFELRPFLPYPSNYVLRLRYLDGWFSYGYYGFNCAAFISNAHGERYFTEREMWAGANGKLILIEEFSDRYHIQESRIRPGDIAVFQGPTTPPYIGHGLHVAAYLGDGTWIDGDARRGRVATFALAQRPATDPWLSGKVRIVRWSQDAVAAFHLRPAGDTFFTSNFVNDYRLADQFAPASKLIARVN